MSDVTEQARQLLDGAVPKMDGSLEVTLRKYGDGRPGSVRLLLPEPFVASFHDLLDEVVRLRAELSEQETQREQTQEDWLSDAESVIHEHCMSDRSHDGFNEWVNEMANALCRKVGPSTEEGGQ